MPGEVLTEISAMLSGISGALPELVSAYPALIPAESLAKIQTDLNAAKAVAAALSPSLPAASGASLVAEIEHYVNDVLTLLGSPPISGAIPAPFNQVFGAVAVVLPVLEEFLSQLLGQVASASPKVISARIALSSSTPDVVSVDQAVKILLSYATS